MYAYRLLSAVCLALCLTGAAQIAAAPAVSPLRLGTATPGGGFELFGRHLAAALNAVDPTLGVVTLPTAGSRENLQRLRSGEIEIGLVEGNAAHRAFADADAAVARLRVLGVMYPSPGMFAVRADSPFHSIEDLKGRAVAFGTSASGLRLLAHDVLDGLGLDAEKDFTPIVLAQAREGPGLVLDGEVAALWGAGIGWPGFVRLAESGTGARFIAPSPAEIDRILQRHPHLRRMTVPGGTYKGQTTPIDSVGLWSLILVRDGLDEGLVHRLAAALHRAQAELAGRLPQGRYATLANTAREVPQVRLHPGVLRYLREQGLGD